MITDCNGLADLADKCFDVVIVGGGPAALAAARGYRQAGGAGSVLMISADPHPPYHRPPLTKDYLRGEVGVETLPLVNDSWYSEQRITLSLQTRVTELDRPGRSVTTEAGTVVGYRVLALATGATPARLPVDGGDLTGVIHVRDRDSAERMRQLRGPTHHVVVIGSGFIGCEAAASLARTGTRVTLVTDEAIPHERRLGSEAGRRIADWLTSERVDLRTSNAVSSIVRRGEEWVIELAGNNSIVVDGVISATGARAQVELAEQAGLSIRDGGVAVDASMRTTDPHVWAAGDMVSALHSVAGRPLRVEHWGEAEIMGEIAGRGMAGTPGRWDTPPGFWSEIGDHTIKYSAWGDGFDVARFAETADGWAVAYGADDIMVGVLTSNRDEVYERGQHLLTQNTDFTAAANDLFG